MGLFNYVRYSAPCPKCGNTLDDWQTKDGDLCMTEVLPSDCNHFYTECRKCKAWVTAKVVVSQYAVVLQTEDE